MRVLYLNFWAHSTSYYTAKFCNAAAAAGADTYLTVPDNFPLQLLNPSVVAEPLKCTAPLKQSLRDILSSATIIPELLRTLHRIRPDWIHVLWAHHLPVILLPLLNRYPLAYTLHDPQPHDGEAGPGLRLTQKALCRRAQAVFVHGSHGRQQLRGNGWCARERIFTIPHGEFGFWNYDIAAPEDDYILFFGRIRRYKGLDVLVDAFESLSDRLPGMRLMICGEGSVDSELRQRILDNPRIIFHNRYIPHDEIETIFRRSRFLVLPYREATQSGVIPMAFALGKTCIATRTGAIPEIVCDDENGILVAPGDFAELADAVYSLYCSRQQRRKLETSALCWARSRDELSWEKAADTAIKAYRSLAQGREQTGEQAPGKRFIPQQGNTPR